jgi:hypothetical protein
MDLHMAVRMQNNQIRPLVRSTQVLRLDVVSMEIFIEGNRLLTHRTLTILAHP